MRILSMLGCLVAILTGIAAMSVDTWSNLEFEAGKALTFGALLDPQIWNSLMAAIVVVAIATAGALAAAGASFRSRRYGLAVGLFVAFLCGAGFSLSATIDRVASSKDAKVYEKRSDNDAIERADAAIARERAKLDAAKAGMKQECDGRNPALLDKKEWPNCRGHWATAEAAREALAEAQARRDALGTTRVEDSGAERIAALFPFVTPKQVTLYQPVLLPVALFLFGNLLTAFGLAGLAPAANAHPRADRAETFGTMRDITPPDPVVSALKQTGRPVNNGELARIMGWSDATASRRVEDLALKGLVSKRRDGRAVMISLK